MYLGNSGDQDRFSHDRGLFRDLSEDDQLYKLYDSESYGETSSLPARPYFVTTDLFWEVYGAAFDGLFIVLEREQAMPAFKRLVDSASEDLRKDHANTSLAKAFSVAQAVLENHADGNPEARLVLAANGQAFSDALGKTIDYAQFRPRGHYKTDDQKRYFGAVRYLSLIELSNDDVALLRSLDPAVAKAVGEWIASYRPFIASSRLDLVWDGNAPKASVASHSGPTGTRIFPLSWAWDNEALDNVVYHRLWPASEQIIARDNRTRKLPSGLDFAAIAGNTLAYQLLERDGLFAEYPNLSARIQATHERFAADSKRMGTLYENWINALATQWANDVSAPFVSGPLWDAKRLQTGLTSWATLRHSTILVNDQTAAERGGDGAFEYIVSQPPRGYVEPDPATFAAIANLFDETINVVRANRIVTGDDATGTQLRDGIIRRLAESRDDTRNFQKIAEKELEGESLTAEDYHSIEYVGQAAEHNFLVFMSLSNPGYALSEPDPMMKVADVAGAEAKYTPREVAAGVKYGSLEAAVGRPLEWDQIVPYYGRREIVKGSIYAYYEFTASEPLDDDQWRARLNTEARPQWVARYLSKAALPARQP